MYSAYFVHCINAPIKCIPEGDSRACTRPRVNPTLTQKTNKAFASGLLKNLLDKKGKTDGLHENTESNRTVYQDKA